MALNAEEMLQRARELPIPTPWVLDEFLANIAKMRGRKIHRIASDLVSSTGSPCGLWLVRPNDDVIIHEASTTDYHIDQIVRHEIGHMILGHDRTYADHPEPQDDATASLHAIMPAIELDGIRAVLGRSAFDDDQEREAEIHAVLGRSAFANDQEREAELLASMIIVAGREQEKKRPRPMMRSVFFPNER